MGIKLEDDEVAAVISEYTTLYHIVHLSLP